MNLFTKQNRLTYKESKFMFTKGESGGGINQAGINIYTLLCIKYITNKDLLYSQGNYTQYLIITYNSKRASQVVLVVKNLSANAGDIGDTGSISRSGRSPGGERGNPLQQMKKNLKQTIYIFFLTESLCCTPKTNTLNQLYFYKNQKQEEEE